MKGDSNINSHIYKIETVNARKSIS